MQAQLQDWGIKYTIWLLQKRKTEMFVKDNTRYVQLHIVLTKGTDIENLILAGKGEHSSKSYNI